MTRQATGDPVLRMRRRRLVLGAVVCVVGVVVVYLLLVRTGWGQRFDDLAFDERTVEDPEITRVTNDLLHRVTRSTLALATGALVLFALARRRPRLALAVAVAVFGSVVSTEVLKLHLLDRPSFTGVAGIAENSYPSGHATIGMALALGVVMVTPHTLRWLSGLVAVGVAVAFGVGVLATGWHRPSDTIGAFLVCLVVFAIVTVGLMSWSSAPVVPGEVEARLHGWVAVASAGLVVAAGVLAIAVTFREDSLRTVELATAYAIVCVAILVLGAGIVVAYQVALRGVSLDPPGVSSQAPAHPGRSTTVEIHTSVPRTEASPPQGAQS